MKKVIVELKENFQNVFIGRKHFLENIMLAEEDTCHQTL